MKARQQQSSLQGSVSYAIQSASYAVSLRRTPRRLLISGMRLYLLIIDEHRALKIESFQCNAYMRTRIHTDLIVIPSKLQLL